MEETRTIDERFEGKKRAGKEPPGDKEAAVRCVSRGDSCYPGRLRGLPDMPEKLYVKGTLPRDDLPSAAVVGARMCSPYGRQQALRYARALSSAGVQVISGLAWGIDAWGHQGALEGGTPTYAVLGNGVDVCYPSRNRPLYRGIPEKGGGILSEYPPGTRPRNYFFPLRNRIISALADVVLVVEAKVKSGSLITAGHALEQGKMVYAVPGPVDAALSEGCHRLIYDGAGIAYSPEILLEELGIPAKMSREKKQIVLASDLNMVYSCFDLRPKSMEVLISETGLAPERISNLLLELELKGLIREVGRHYYVKEE